MAKRYFPFDTDNAFEFLSALRRAKNKQATLQKAFANVPQEAKQMPGLAPSQWEEAIVAAELVAAHAVPSPHFKLPEGIDVNALSVDAEMLKTARETVTRLLQHAPLPDYTHRDFWDVYEAGWNDLLVRLGGQALPPRVMPELRIKWALQDFEQGTLHEDLLASAPPQKHASEADEGALLRLLQTMQKHAQAGTSLALPSTLNEVSRTRLAMLAECTNGLRCVLAYHPIEEPNVFLDVLVHPLWSLALALPFVGQAVDARAFARTALEAAYLLGGDGALGVLAMMSTEATYGDYHPPVYPPGLAALSSWLPWAVRVIEEAAAAGDFAPESIAESAPLLAAARFEVARRVHWPSARSAWSWMHCMPASSRGDEAAWHATQARIEALTDAVARAEAGPLPAAGKVSPGDLVRIPKKGVTVVLACSNEADVVAAYARPTRARVAYPKGVLPLCALGVSVPFFGAPSDDAEARAWKHFNEVVWKLREKNPEEPLTHHAMLQNILNDRIGLEAHVARPETPLPYERRSHARSALCDVLHHITVPCDPLLAAHAEAQLPGLLDAILRVPDDSPLARQEALMMQALVRWLHGEDASEAVAQLEASILSEESSSAYGLVTHAVTLASFGRWDAVAKLKKRGEAAAKKDAKGNDFRESTRGERYLDTWKILSALCKSRDALNEPAIRAAIRRELEYEASWSIDFEHLHWLRILYWREGTSGLTPREVVLTSYFALSGERRSGKTQVRTCPPAMEAELEALRVRIGYEPPAKPEVVAPIAAPPVPAKVVAETQPAKVVKPKPLTPKQLEERAAWDAARKSAKPYSRLEHYVVGGSLMHPKFGLGRVRRLVTPDTIEVLFENGVPRTLGHRA